MQRERGEGGRGRERERLRDLMLYENCFAIIQQECWID